jgi:hypothetical protein
VYRTPALGETKASVAAFFSARGKIFFIGGKFVLAF